MDSLLRALSLVLPLAYFGANVVYGRLFFRSEAGAGAWATRLLRGTALLHLGFLVALAVRWRQLPAVTVSQALSIVALAVALVYLFLEWLGRERTTGFWMVALVFLFQLLSTLLYRPTPPPDREIFHNPLFGAHVSLALLGYAAFAVAAGYGFLFLELYRELKAGHFRVFFGKLPPLQVLERMMAGGLAVGFVALTGAAVLGASWAQQLYGERWVRDPKILFTFATWLLYATALVLRRLHRWQGRQTAMASLAGLGAILFSLLAVNFLLSGFHRFL